MQNYIVDFTSSFVIFTIVGLFVCRLVENVILGLDRIKLNKKEKVEEIKNIHPLLEENLDEEKIARISEYNSDCEFLNIASDKIRSSFTVPLFLFGILSFGFSWIVENITVVDIPGRILIASTIYALFKSIVNIPCELYADFRLEKKYGFSNMTGSLFVRDFLKHTIVSFVISGIGIYALFYVLKYALNIDGLVLSNNIINPVVIVGLVGINILFDMVLSPVYMYFIDPLFNKFQKVESGELKDKMEKLVEKSGRKFSGIYVIDESKRSNHLNAYCNTIPFTNVTRIVIFDNLMKKLTTDEIVAIFAHELTHMRNHDCTRGMVVGIVPALLTGLIVSLFALDVNLFHAFGLRWITQENVRDFALVGISMSSLLASSVLWVLNPLFSWFSRRMEYKADEGAVRLCGNNEDLMTALIKLYMNDLGDVLTHPAYEMWYHSHPAIVNRLKAIKEVK